MKRALSLVLEHKIAKPGRNQGRRFPRSTVRLTRPKLVNDQRLDEDRALGDGDSLLAFFGLRCSSLILSEPNFADSTRRSGIFVGQVIERQGSAAGQNAENRL